MLFNSLAFVVFAAVFFPLYFWLRGRARLWWCLLASYFFYSWWDYRFVVLIGGSTCLTYWCGRRMDRAATPGRRRGWLLVCAGAHLGALAFFKYTNFLLASVGSLLGWAGVATTPPQLDIVLPVGISFYTFTALSYSIDIYRGKLKGADHTLLQFATYECLFPHLVAGPILRASTFLPQLKQDAPASWHNVGRGLEMIAWGYVLKLCLADNAALFSDARFEHPELFTRASLLVGLLAFTWQIYGDFAGYSLIAIGLARVMGFDFGTNFARPYFAAGFSDFWQRWHISLSSWIRDYIYIPLGGNRCGTTRNAVNLLGTMLLAGLWHGAGWTFVCWGLLHGLYLVGQRAVSGPYARCCAALRVPDAVARLVAILMVFGLTALAWVFFRARTMGAAVDILGALGGLRDTAHLSFGGMKFQLIRVGLAGLLVLGVDAVASQERWRSAYLARPGLRAAGIGACVVVILFLGRFAANSFIYFQF